MGKKCSCLDVEEEVLDARHVLDLGGHIPRHPVVEQVEYLGRAQLAERAHLRDE